MNMFDEIDKVKKKLPTLKTVTNEVTSHNLNNYQIVNRNYQDNIIYTITCNELEFNTLKENNYNICNINKILIKK